MDLSRNELNSIWNDFLKAWPIEKVQSMTIDQYSQLGDHNSFIYWLEHRLKPHGSIRGGDSSKFGIYNYRKPPKKTHIDTDDSYAWQRKYGDSADKAFHNVKEMILQVINAVQRKNLDSVDGIDLGEAFKWKIAYHYQDRANPIVVNIFKPEMLKQYLHLTTNSMAELNKKAMLELSQYDDVFLLGKKIWQSLESNAENSEVNTMSSTRPCWFVGASDGGSEDQTAKFVEEGVWINGYEDKYLDLVRSIQEGDRIAIKSAYTRKQGLPFDNEGKSVSVMAIKAVGTVKENFGDGRNLKVRWEPIDPAREWFFYTYQRTVWKVMPGNWCKDGLIAFAFDGEPQDIERFRNDPFWFDRYGGQHKAGTVLEQFLDEVASIRNLQTKEEAGDFILQDDPWSEVKTRINFIDSFNSIVSNSNWQISELKTLLQRSALFSGSISMGSMVSSFFNHPDASSWLKHLITEVSVVDEDVNSLVEQLVNISFTGKDNKPKRSEAAYFLSMLLSARYPDLFMEFRQCRLDALTDAFGVPKVTGNYGKRLIEAGVLAGNLSSLNQFQEVFADIQYPNAVIGGLAYLIEKKEAWIEDIKMAEADPRKENILTPINQILYGPPGTGKTYNTVFKAVDICRFSGDVFPSCKKHAESHDESCYDCAKLAYKQLKDEGLIEFITFHQSYGYEEFIEGIRPVLSNEAETDGIAYQVEPGVLKRIARKAEDNLINSRSSCGEKVDIEFLLNDFAHEIQERILHDDKPLLTIEEGFKHKSYIGDVKTDSDGGFKSFITTGSVKDQSLTKSIILRDYQAFYDGIIKAYKDIKPTFKSQAAFHGNGIYYFQLFLVMKEFQVRSEEKYLLGKAEKTLKPHVLVIDEINRGNMSKIFGELITLIEEDKRIGAPNEMQVRLPNSGEEFGVPKNLHIIGTMNTADRSIAMMDTALRRRFEFKEMMPQPRLLSGVKVEGVILEKMLQKINERIEVLYDREHTIGHAYFMSLDSKSSIDDLAVVFENKIIPLLAEYFFEDWEKIRMVLGDHLKAERNIPEFIQEIENVNLERLFGGEVDDMRLEERKVYERNSEALEDPRSYIAIYDFMAAQTEPDSEESSLNSSE